MLFDLRGRGRRRTVQAIYLTLAVLMGGGLVFFGVGGTGVGIFNSDEGGGSATSGSDVIEERLEQAEQAVRRNPRDAAAWGELARQRYLAAERTSSDDPTAPVYTDAGLEDLQTAERAWDRHVRLADGDVSLDVARLMAQAFDSRTGLALPEKEVAALEVVIDQDPTAAAYQRLAEAAYLANQTRKAELATAEALRRYPEDQRPRIKSEIESVKEAVAQQQAEQAAPPDDPLNPAG